jgi:uncharacterized protein YlxW (UPF0749 family)
MEILLVILGGALLFLLKKNKDLRSDKKLDDLKNKDSILEKEQKDIKLEKEKLKKEIDALDKASKDLSTEEIEEFWRNKN